MLLSLNVLPQRNIELLPGIYFIDMFFPLCSLSSTIYFLNGLIWGAYFCLVSENQSWEGGGSPWELCDQMKLVILAIVLTIFSQSLQSYHHLTTERNKSVNMTNLGWSMSCPQATQPRLVILPKLPTWVGQCLVRKRPNLGQSFCPNDQLTLVNSIPKMTNVRGSYVYRN